MKYVWHERSVPRDLSVTQVHGVLLTRDGRVLIRIKNGEARLTGGRPEKGESWEEALRREAMEEASVRLGEICYLGYQVPEGEQYAQVRLVALIDEIFPAKPDPDRDNNWIYGRELVPLTDARRRLVESFGDIGERLVDAAAVAGKKWFDSPNQETEILNIESKDEDY